MPLCLISIDTGLSEGPANSDKEELLIMEVKLEVIEFCIYDDKTMKHFLRESESLG